MTRKAKLISVVFAAATLMAEAAAMPAFADQNKGKPHPKIDVKVGKVTKSPDHPKKDGDKR